MPGPVTVTAGGEEAELGRADVPFPQNTHAPWRPCSTVDSVSYPSSARKQNLGRCAVHVLLSSSCPEPQTLLKPERKKQAQRGKGERQGLAQGAQGVGAGGLLGAWLWPFLL